MKIRAIAHVHSEWSYDGNWSLPKLAFLFKLLGYNCILTSEHDEKFNNNRWKSYRESCIRNSSKELIIIPGIEYSDKLNIVHMLVWGDLPFLGSKRETTELLREVKEYGGIAIMAHPSRKKAWERYESHWTPLLMGIEQWNRKVDGIAPSQEAKLVLEKNSGLIPFIGLDFHKLNHFFPLCIVWEHNGKFTEDNILNTFRLKKGNLNIGGAPIDYFLKGYPYKILKSMENIRKEIRDRIKIVFNSNSK